MHTTWKAVDQYFAVHLRLSDPLMDAVLQANAEEKLPPIDVAPSQGKLLYLLAKMQRAARILEIGTLGGYSTIWLGRALPPEGRLITLELNPRHAAVAQRNIARAGLADRVEVIVGPAAQTLPQLKERDLPPFDLVFIDADKQNSLTYMKWALEYVRPGAVIVVDNVVRGGRVINKDDPDPQMQGIRELMEFLAREPAIEATAIQTVGEKGYDGFLVALVG